MNEKGFESRLAEILNDEGDVKEILDPHGVRKVATFADAGVLTMNAGLVITMDDGAEFQITIVRSRRGRRDAEEAL